PISSFFFFPSPHTPHIYTLSLHDALPILTAAESGERRDNAAEPPRLPMISHSSNAAISRNDFISVTGDSERPENHDATVSRSDEDRKSTRLNSSHVKISYAVFCLKKKKT